MFYFPPTDTASPLRYLWSIAKKGEFRPRLEWTWKKANFSFAFAFLQIICILNTQIRRARGERHARVRTLGIVRRAIRPAFPCIHRRGARPGQGRAELGASLQPFHGRRDASCLHLHGNLASMWFRSQALRWTLRHVLILGCTALNIRDATISIRGLQLYI